jgi:hypothetical protein
MQRMEQDRERFLELEQPPMPGFQPPTSGPAAPARDSGTYRTHPAETRGTGAEDPSSAGNFVDPPALPPRDSYAPQDWDNLWYYRGY